MTAAKATGVSGADEPKLFPAATGVVTAIRGVPATSGPWWLFLSSRAASMPHRRTASCRQVEVLR